MHVSTFDRYETGASLIHRLDARVKVVVTVLFILSNVLLPDGAWLAFLLAWGMVLAVNLLARLQWSYALKRSFIALPFALAAITVIFSLAVGRHRRRPGPFCQHRRAELAVGTDGHPAHGDDSVFRPDARPAPFARTATVGGSHFVYVSLPVCAGR